MDERRGAGGGHRDEPGVQRGPLGADPLHAHVPADEADDRDDRRLPQQSGGLRAVGAAQRGAVEDDSGHGRLDGRHTADRGGQQPRPERPQDGYGEDGEAHLTGQGAHGVRDPGAVGAPPPLDGEGAGRDEQRPVQNGALRTAPFEGRHDDGDHHGRAAHEDSRNRGFRTAFGSDDGDVEPDHADRRQKREADPLAGREAPQRSTSAPAGERDEQQTGQGVPQELAARAGVVAEDAVGGEGTADEDTGERGEQGAAGGGVHDGDARKPRGPV